MARTVDGQDEIREAMRREAWSLTGPNRIVKVTPLGIADRRFAGFIGLEKALVRKTPMEIERALGLRTWSLAWGCSVFRFTRLPLAHEVEYELGALYPNGQAYNPAMHDARYQPGSAAVHQWCLKFKLPAQHLLDLLPGQRYPAL